MCVYVYVCICNGNELTVILMIDRKLMINIQYMIREMVLYMYTMTEFSVENIYQIYLDHDCHHYCYKLNLRDAMILMIYSNHL